MNSTDFFVHPYVVFLVRCFLGLVFLVAGVSKLLKREKIFQEVASYEILPTHAARLYALILPWLETIIALSLLVGFWTHAAAFIAILLLSSFIIAISVNIW